MIRLSGVNKSFRDLDHEHPILRGIDLEVEPGEMVAIVGPSGSGKSTLLYVSGALDRDYTGEVEIAGTKLSGLSTTELAALRNRSVGFVFQSFNLLDGLTAVENVMLPGVLRTNGELKDVRSRARLALQHVGLEHRADARPGNLSGGERQRVALARALLSKPSVLLADEPTGNLDAATGETIIGIFRELARSGIAVLVVTHEERVSRAANRVLRLEEGRLR